MADFCWLLPKAARPLSFRVSDADRRRKVVDARTRVVQVGVYGDFDFGCAWSMMGATDKRPDPIAAGLLFGGGNGCLRSGRPIVAMSRPLLRKAGTALLVPRGLAAPGAMLDMLCRVTTLGSRMRGCRMAARGADIAARRSR
jgi:hypothetical protein